MNAVGYAEKISDIFVMSDSFVRIKELIDDESSTIDDISDVILLDPALTGTILKLANSSLFNYPGKIDTISKAVLVLGITEVYNLVIAYFTKEAFITFNADNEFLDSYWRKSVDCSLLLRFLGHELNIPNSERLFVLGLLHNLGELVVQQLTPEYMEACNTVTGSQQLWEKQQKVLGFTFADCSAELLKLWQLPYSLVEPVRNQDESDFEYATVETKLLYVCKRMMLLDYQRKISSAAIVLCNEKMEALKIDDDLAIAANKYCVKERLNIIKMLQL